jgi:hypothetical protein
MSAMSEYQTCEKGNREGILHNKKVVCCWPCLPTSKARILCVFRFIIEYSSLKDFYRPLGNNNNRSIYFYRRIFER